MKERRRAQRRQVMLSAEVIDVEGQSLPAIILNVSSLDALVEHQGQILPTQRYDLVIHLPDRAYRIPAEAVRSSVGHTVEKGGERYLVYRTAFTFQEPARDLAILWKQALGEEKALGAVAEELRALKRRQEVISTTLGEGVVETDASHRVVAVNPAALALFERTEEELLGAELVAAIDPEGVGLLREVIAKLADAEAPRTEILALPYGEKLLQVTATPLIEEERYAGLVVIVRDITEVYRLREALSTLHEVAALLSSLSPQKLLESLQKILEWSAILLRADAGGLLMLDGGTGELVVTAVAGADEKALRGRRLPAEEGFAGWVTRTGKPMRVDEAEKDPRVTRDDALLGLRPRSLLGAPLKHQGRVLGVILLVRAGGRPFTDQDLGLLSTLALQMALALDHARLEERRVAT